MKKCICDICHENEADYHYKVKRSGRFWNIMCGEWIWSGYKKLDVCKHCGEKLLFAANNVNIDKDVIEKANDTIEKLLKKRGMIYEFIKYCSHYFCSLYDFIIGFLMLDIMCYSKEI